RSWNRIRPIQSTYSRSTVPDTNLSHDSNLSQRPNEGAMEVARKQEKQGVRTHVLLVVAMALVIAIVTCVCLMLIRHRLRKEVTDGLSRDLNHSVTTFQDLEAERVGALERENSLL